MEVNAKNNRRLLTIGGFGGVVFSLVYLLCGTGYLLLVGIPSTAPNLSETAIIMSHPTYKLLFWIWPIGILAVIPFGLAVREYLQTTSPAMAKIGTTFLLFNAGLWFVFNASWMTSIGLASMEPLPEKELGTFIMLVGNLGSPLFWTLTIYMACFAVGLIPRSGVDKISGFAFALGSFTSLVYFVMRYTGPYQLAEIVHEFLILFMIIGVGSLGVSLIRQGRNPNR